MFLQQIHPSKDSYSFRKKILQQLKRKIPYEAYCFTTVDSETLLSTGAITDERIELLHPQLFENEYKEEDLNRYTELFEKKFTVIQFLKPQRVMYQIVKDSGKFYLLMDLLMSYARC